MKLRSTPRICGRRSLVVVALGALTLFIGMGPSGCDPGGGATCAYDGTSYSVGASFPSTDGCNSCSCLASGEVACTLRACVDACSYGGKTYTAGQTFPATDGCNSCTCGAGGTVSCTELGCVEGCDFNGGRVAVGDTVDLGDGCNICTCLTSGEMACTGVACGSGCNYNGQWRADQTYFDAVDGCNKCSCDHGSVSCTEKACPGCHAADGSFYPVGANVPTVQKCTVCTCLASGEVECLGTPCPPPSCSYNGEDSWPGDVFPAGDGCNTCTCMEFGEVSCTDKACGGCVGEDGKTYPVGAWVPTDKPCTDCHCEAPGELVCLATPCAGIQCKYNGGTYWVGDSFPAKDGCNTCICGEDGYASCTEKACTCDPDAEWNRKYVGDSPEICALIDYICPQNTTYFSNTCGCGCEQSPDCPAGFDCMPPTPVPCDEAALKTQCPYSGIVY